MERRADGMVRALSPVAKLALEVDQIDGVVHVAHRGEESYLEAELPGTVQSSLEVVGAGHRNVEELRSATPETHERVAATTVGGEDHVRSSSERGVRLAYGRAWKGGTVRSDHHRVRVVLERGVEPATESGAKVRPRLDGEADAGVALLEPGSLLGGIDDEVELLTRERRQAPDQVVEHRRRERTGPLRAQGVCEACLHTPRPGTLGEDRRGGRGNRGHLADSISGGVNPHVRETLGRGA